MIHWTVYTRADCHLCEIMLSELAGLLGPAAMQVHVVDIGNDAALEAKYGRRVPVLMADGEFVCAYKLDEHRVKVLLGS